MQESQPQSTACTLPQTRAERQESFPSFKTQMNHKNIYKEGQMKLEVG